MSSKSKAETKKEEPTAELYVFKIGNNFIVSKDNTQNINNGIVIPVSKGTDGWSVNIYQ
jgi:hypothetical protein